MPISTKVSDMLPDPSPAKEILDATAPTGKKGRGPGRPKKEIYHFQWTPEQKLEFERKAKEWFDNPEGLDPYIVEVYLKQLPMLEQFAYNPAPGRSGPMLAMQAMKDFRDLSVVVLELLDKRKRIVKPGIKREPTPDGSKKG